MQDVQKMYKNVRMGPKSEKVTDTFIDVALRVHKSVFSVPGIAKLLLYCDSKYGVDNPFDSLHKIDKISRKAKGEELVWAFNGLHDGWKHSLLSDSALAVRAIDGIDGKFSCGGKGKGIVETMIMKMEVKAACMEKVTTDFQWQEDVKTKIKIVTDNHEVFREWCGCADQRANITWRAGWPHSAVNFLTFVEDWVY